MSIRSSAVKALLGTIADGTYDRYRKWFADNPRFDYCYWSANEPIAPDQTDNQELLDLHPEIKDIHDHTMIRMDGNRLVAWAFCPEYRSNFNELLGDRESFRLSSGKVSLELTRDGENFRVVVTPEEE